MRAIRLSLILAALTACGTGDAADGSSADDVPKFMLEEEIRIGSMDDPDLGFSQIGAVDVDSDGNVYVSERSEFAIRIYDAGGKRLRTVGGRGEGPGEFGTLSSFGVQGDTLWVHDSRLRRITLFDREGNLLATVPATGVSVPSPPESGFTITMRPNAMRPDGRFTSVPGVGISGDPRTLRGGDTLRLPRLVFDASGEVVDTAGFMRYPTPTLIFESPERIKVGDRELRKPEPPTDQPLVRRLDDGELIVDRLRSETGDEAVLTVTRLGPVEDTIFRRQFRYTPREYGADAVDSIIASYVSSGMRAGQIVTVDGMMVAVAGVGGGSGPPPDSAALDRAYRDALELPKYQPPVGSYRLGEDGTVWLRREEDGTGTYRWFVLEPDGEPRGEVEVPRALRILWSDDATVWGVELDDFEVPWLAKYRIVEAKAR